MKVGHLSAVLFILASAVSGLAAEEAADAENREAAHEEADQKKRENELDRPIFSFIVGTLDLKPAEQRGDGNGVVATLTGKSEYLVKVADPALTAELEKFNGKRVKLRGNPRNKGKYFLVQAVSLAQAADK